MYGVAPNFFSSVFDGFLRVGEAPPHLAGESGAAAGAALGHLLYTAS